MAQKQNVPHSLLLDDHYWHILSSPTYTHVEVERRINSTQRWYCPCLWSGRRPAAFQNRLVADVDPVSEQNAEMGHGTRENRTRNKEDGVYKNT